MRAARLLAAVALAAAACATWHAPPDGAAAPHDSAPAETGSRPEARIGTEAGTEADTGTTPGIGAAPGPRTGAEPNEPKTGTGTKTEAGAQPSSNGTEAPAPPTPSPPATLPSPLPPPDSPPLVPPPAVDLSDPLELLWGHRLEFGAGGEPLVTIRLMEGQREIVFRPLGPARVLLRGGTAVEVPANARLSVRAREAVPAAIAWHALLADVPLADRARLEPLRAHYEERGIRVERRVVGGVYGIAGRVVDNRRELLLAESDGTEAGARAAVETLRERLGERATLHTDVVARPAGRLELRAGAAPLGEADAALTVVVEGDAGFVVEGVEHERGPTERAREDRSYRGRLFVTLDVRGTLAAVHGVPLEELLRGLVPSEMPGSSHPEALRAQAVTARSNVLAQIGARHLTDPFMLCAEVHCQAYRGDAARTARTDAAVRATRGEALFGRADRTLVDAVYSAMCGGHGEDNEGVWGNAPDASLRGHPDGPAPQAARWAGGLADESALRAFLAAPLDAFCRRPAAARKDRFRWERRFARAELDVLVAPLAVGAVRALEVVARGVSGRARVLRIVGEERSAEVSGELRIRRLLRNLPSSMFVVERDGETFVLRGGGWGHGAGMCQWGAVGRAEAGQGYREILRAYFSGAEVGRIY